MNRKGSVSKTTDYSLEDRGLFSGRGNNFFFAAVSKLVQEITQFHI
jgi:hypothetical protein